jgi:Ca-activated chloride channel family protein
MSRNGAPLGEARPLRRLLPLLVALLFPLVPLPAGAAGTLQPKDSAAQPIQIRSHAVRIVLDNGFAETEVTQTFWNPNPAPLEAIYSFPLPKSASLSELDITSGETTIRGEVLPKAEARKAYEEERDKGNDSGLATKNGFQSFDFAVSPVRPGQETKIRFVYYQPLEIDSGMGKYVYPLAEGGTDEAAIAFWSRNEQVEGSFSVDVDLKSAWPVDAVRTPGFENEATIQKKSEGRWSVHVERAGAKLDHDFVLYYRLADGLPGRVELTAYKPDKDKTGTFLMVVTPGIDLQPIRHGSDWVFILDRSGSMQTKLPALARGVAGALKGMRPEDRFRIVTFASSASDLLPGKFLSATPENVARAVSLVEGLASGDSTNMYEAIERGLDELDADRATGIVLVTDGVTNTGEIDPKKFNELLKKYDLRVFAFVMGNSANWPLMNLIASASGGFASGVSQDDDIVGQVILARSKITSECLHDASWKISGVEVHDVPEELLGKVWRGQQLVFFGRYEKGGFADVELKARLTGQDRTYRTRFEFPDVDLGNPELERLWALDRVERIEQQRMIGALPEAEAASAIRDLGVSYQIVTDETSMVVLTDTAYTSRGIERMNAARVAIEQAAKTARAAAPPRDRRVDGGSPAFPGPAPTVGGKSGGGALDPFSALAAAGLAAAGLLGRRRRREVGDVEEGR